MQKFIILLLFIVFCSNAQANNEVYKEILLKAEKASAISESGACMKLLRAGLQQSLADKNEYYTARFYLAIADEYLLINEIDSIDFYYQRAHLIFERLKDETGLIRTETGLLELSRRTNPSSTMDKYLELLNRARLLVNKDLYYLVLEKIIMVNNGMENYKEAFSQTHECINYYEGKGNTYLLAIKFREIAALFFTRSGSRQAEPYDFDSSIYYHKKAIELSSKIHANRNLVFAYQRLSWLLYKKDIVEAWRYIQIADSIDKKYQIRSPQLPNIMSFSLFQMGRVQEAIAKSYEALALGMKARQLFIGIQAADQLCIYYKASKRYDSALYFKELSEMINDSIRSQRNYKDAAKMQARLEFEKETYEKELLQKESLKRQNLIILFTISGIVVLLIITFILYRAYLLNKRSTAIIKAQNDEKTILIKEIHHRVKNNLSVISGILDLQKRSIKDEKMLDVFKDAKSRINSMALVHINLYEQEDLTTINSQVYFENLYKTVNSAYKMNDKQINSVIQCEGVNINIDTIIPLALITNELLTNSFKYAFEGKQHGTIRISLKNTGAGFLMDYSDDGMGVHHQTNSEKHEGLGTMLISGLIKQLDGTMTMNSDDAGMKYQFNFKGIHV
ncbi:MAG: sensor histidine kinase [Bacteroidia bacterium]